MKQELLRVENVYGYYIEKRILNNFVFNVYHNEIVGLFGLNNSGKTTFMHLLSGMIDGVWHKDIYIEGKKESILSRADAVKHGIHCIFPQTALFENLTVTENVLIFGNHSSNEIYSKQKKSEENVQYLLNLFGLSHINTNQKVGSLAISQKYKLEIIRAVLLGAKVLFFDYMEKTDTLLEIESLRETLMLIKKMGISSVLLINKTIEKFFFVDRIVAMRRGMRVKEFSKPDYDKELIGRYVGDNKTHESSVHLHESSLMGRNVLEVEEISLGDKALSFTAYAGRIMGILSPQSEELGEFMQFFIDGTGTCRTLKFCGKDFNNGRIPRKVRKQIYVLPKLDDAHTMFPNFDIAENITIGSKNLSAAPLRLVSKAVKKVVIQEEAELIEGAQKMRRDKVRSHVINLKIVGRRMRMLQSKACILFKPFLGLDDSSVRLIKNELQKIAQTGVTVIVLASEETEISDICDTIIKL